jgi:hypothetical protein
LLIGLMFLGIIHRLHRLMGIMLPGENCGKIKKLGCVGKWRVGLRGRPEVGHLPKGDMCGCRGLGVTVRRPGATYPAFPQKFYLR